jgi:PAS domain S-box-containing protein
VTEAKSPRLDTLESHAAPCFLWDPDRLRIVWANEAGLSFFGAETLFDLLDRQFDHGEGGAAAVRRISKTLAPEEERSEALSFPSAGSDARFLANCSLHRLSDGRMGVLTMGEKEATAQDMVEIAEAFMNLPYGALIVGNGNHIRHQNKAALEFTAHLPKATLGALFGDETTASSFARRIMEAGTVSDVRSIKTAIGTRDVRLTGRRLKGQPPGQQTLVVALEDITERRALERALTKGDAKPVPAAAGLPQSPDETQPKKQSNDSDVPAIVRAKLDSFAKPIVIMRGAELLHANKLALELLRLPSVGALRERADIVDTITSKKSEVTIAVSEGNELSLAIERSPIPWNMGEAIQAQLSVLASVAIKPEQPPQPTEATAVSEAVTAAPEPASWKPDDAELSAILDTASDGIITLDADGCIRSFSAGAEAIFGQPKAIVLGKPFAELLTSDTQKTFRDYLAALTDSGLAAVFNDGREVSANVGQGGSLPLFLTISKFHLEARESVRRPAFCAVVRDITQWKQTEAELREAKEKAEQTSRQKSEFLARISHELRTPLNAILGFSEVMRLERFGKLQNEKYRDYVSDIYASGAHLLSLINDLLDLSKVEAGKLELTFTSVNLPDVTDHAMRLLAERAQQGRISLRRNFPSDLPNVVADLRSMRQILLNLLSNSIKFTDPGGQVMVTGRVTKAGELILRVKDTGIGMSAEELEGALEPFRRIEIPTRPDSEGTGLGLPLTKALTEANRATFSISSERGKGTMVEITYPTTRVLAD